MYHNHGFGYSNYNNLTVTDRNRDGLITESDFVASARANGWGYAGLNIFFN